MNQGNHWAIGLLVVLGGQLVIGGGLGVLSAFTSGRLAEIALVFLLVPGLTQLLWTVPLAIWAGMTGRKSTLIGALVTAGIVFLLNAGCWATLAAMGGVF